MTRGSLSLVRFLFPFAMLALWEATGFLGLLNPLLLSYPSEILGRVLEIAVTGGDPIRVPSFYVHLRTTLLEVIVAFLLVIVVGLPLGFVLGTSRFLSSVYEPFLLALFAFPYIILYPIIFLIFGIGPAPKMVIGFSIGVFYLIFNASAGVRQVDRNLISMAISMGYTKLKTFSKVIVPFSFSTILSGLRLGFAYSFVGVIVGELVLPNEGLGFLIEWTGVRFFVPELFALIVITVGIGGTGDIAFRLVEGRMWRWKTA